MPFCSTLCHDVRSCRGSSEELARDDGEASDEENADADQDDIEGDEDEGKRSSSDAKKSTSGPDKDGLARIRKLAIRRLGQIMKDYPSYKFAPHEAEILFIIDAEVEKLHQQVINEKAGSILDLVLILSRHSSTAVFLKPTLHKILSCLALPVISVPVRTELFNLLDNLLRLRDAQPVEEDAMEVDEAVAPSKEPIDLVRPHGDLLLEAFKIRFANDYGTKRRKIGHRELTLVERLAVYATSTEAADQLVALLVPFLRMKGIQLNAREHILTIFRTLVPLLTNPMSYGPTLARLFISFPSRESREAVCGVYEQLSTVAPSLKTISSLLSDLNSWVDMRATEEPDYDRRFSAYQRINEELLPTLSEIQLLPVVYNYLFFLAHPDLSLRSNAAHGLSKLIQLISEKGAVSNRVAALVPDILLPAIKKNLDHHNISARAEYVDLLRCLVTASPKLYPDLHAMMRWGETSADEADEDANFFKAIFHLQMHRRQKAVQKFTLIMKQEAIVFSPDSLMNILFPILKSIILEATVRQHNYVDDLIAAVAAISRVVDWTRYSRIIQTFVDAMPKLPLIENQLVKLVVKVLDEFHFDVSKDFSPKIAAAPLPQSKFSVETPVTDAVKQLFAADVAAAKEGEEADASAAAPEQPEADKMDVDNAQEGPATVEAPAVEAVEDDDDGEDETVEAPKPAQVLESDADRLQRTIQHHLVNRLLPTLHDRLKEGKGSHTVRAPVALAIIKLLQLMPSTISEFQIARLLTRLCAELASRAQANRDSCRETLRQILSKLGAKYFPFVLQMMEANLIRGYQLHVLSFSVHDLLKALVPIYKPGEIDSALPHLQKILFKDMLGVAEEQRQEAKIQHSMKETKKSYSLDSFQLIAQAIDFAASSHTLVSPVREALIGAGGSLATENSTFKQSDVQLIKKLSDILDQIVIGLKQNTSVQAKDLFVFCFLMIKENMDSEAVAAAAAEDEAAQAAAEAEAGKTGRPKPFRKQRLQLDPRKAAKFIVEPDPRRMKSKIEAVVAGNEHILAVFALQTLQTFLKGAEQAGESVVNRKNPEHIAMIDPFVKLLFKCMGSRYDRLLVTSLKVLCQIVKIPNVPTVQSKCSAIGKRAIVLLQKANPHSELLQTSFKMLTTLYREVKTFELGDHHLNIVMNFLRTALETLDNPNLVFSLFKSLVWRKVLHPTIYDMIPQLNEMLVKTAAQSVRSHCEAIMMQFMVSYPLGEKRLQQHLDGLMANLNYDFEPGRLALLNVLYAIFGRFPQEIVQNRLEYFTLPLVAQMINDDSKAVRSRAAEVISAIIKAVDADHKGTLLSMTLSWYAPSSGSVSSSSEEARKKISLQLAAARLVPIFVPLFAQIGGETFEKFISRVLPLMKQILIDSKYDDQDEIDLLGAESEEDIYDSSLGWQLMYLSMVALEKLVHHQNKITGRKDFIPVLEWVSGRLLHPHPWIRLVASRIIGCYFGFRHEIKDIEPKLRQREAAGKRQKNADGEADDFLLRPRSLFGLVKLFCKQLESDTLTQELGTQVVKNMLFASTNLLRHPGLTPVSADDYTEVSDDEDEAAEGEASDKEEFGSDGEEAEGKSEEKDDEEEQEKKRVGLPPLEWVFRRLSYMARKDGTTKRTCIFQFFAAISMQLTTEELSASPRAFLMPIINPLFRIHENDEIKAEDPLLGELKQLAGEVLSVVKKRAGSPAFLAAFEAVRRSVSKIRGERKQARKILAISDPKRAALVRMRKHKKNRERKKRKIDEMKVNKTRLKVRKLE